MTAFDRRRLVQLGVAVLLVAPTVLLVAGRGGAAPELGNYNGTVSATEVHDLGDLALLCRGSQMADGVDAAAIAQAPEKPRQDIGDFGGSPASGGENQSVARPIERSKRRRPVIDGNPDFVLLHELVDRTPERAVRAPRQGHAAFGLHENAAVVGGDGIDVIDGRGRLQAELDNAGGAGKIEAGLSSRAQKDSHAIPSGHQVLVVAAAGFSDPA